MLITAQIAHKYILFVKGESKQARSSNYNLIIAWKKKKEKNFVEEFRRQNQTQDNKAQADFLREFVAEFRRQSISEAENSGEHYQ